MKLRAGQRFWTGYTPDPEGHRRTPFAALSRRLKAQTLPDAFSLAQFMPPIMDQGQTGSCTGHATAGATFASLAAAGTPLGWVPSPHGIYTVGRALDRPDPSVALEDNGAEPNQVMRGITEWGVRPMQAPAPDGRVSDCEPSTINVEPQWDELEKDSTALLVGEYEIVSTGAQRIEDLKVALAVANAGVTVAIDGGSDAFQSYAGGILASAGLDLDHYIYAVAFGIDAGVFFLDLANSWSTGWGEAGRVRIGAQAVAELGDLVVTKVTRKAA